MNSQGRGTSSPSLNRPMKRKRGRPRKDGSPLHGENKAHTPGFVAPMDVEDDMVGQVVTGVIEGSFDAGYLLNVKVGSIGSNMRGVVFLPGRFSPITASNDVAPCAKMYERKEISVPVCNLPTPLYSSGSPPEDSKQIEKQNVELISHTPPLPNQNVLSEPNLSTSMTAEKPSDFFVGNLQDNFQKNGGNLCLDSDTQNQIQESELASQSAPSVEDSNVDKATIRNEDFGLCNMMKGDDMKAELSEALGSVQASEPISVPVVETVTKESQNEQLPIEEHNELIDDEIKIPKLDCNQTSVISEVEQNNEFCKNLMDSQVSPKDNTTFQSELEFVSKNSPIRGPGGDNAFVTESSFPSTVGFSQPMRIVEHDVDVVPKVATELFYCPGLFDSHPCISSGPISDVECNAKDTINDKSVRPEFTEPQLFISAGAAGSEMECDGKDINPSTQIQ